MRRKPKAQTSYRAVTFPPRGDTLPRSQAKVLGFLVDEMDRCGLFPSNSEIAIHMGWKRHACVRSALSALIYDGRLEMIGRNGRGAAQWRLRRDSIPAATNHDEGTLATERALHVA